MSEIRNFDTLLEIQKEDGSKERHFPFTKLENVIGAEDVPLYPKALALLAIHPYFIDDTTGKIYRIGINNGELYYVQTDVGVKEILAEIEGLFEETTTDP